MKIIVNQIRVYEYHELNEDAKERVKEWYLDDINNNNCFAEDIEVDLQNLFPNSDLKVTYSLSYCQGDGLNVYGTINFNDFLEIDSKTNSNIFSNYTPKEIARLKFYFKYIDDYTFENDSRYSYSHKFIDKKYARHTLMDMFDELIGYHELRDVDEDLFTKFFMDMLNWFEDYDEKMEKAGYKFFYEVEDGEVEEVCSSNNYMFLEDGTFYGRVYEYENM